jgi:hypothetical protein
MLQPSVRRGQNQTDGGKGTPSGQTVPLNGFDPTTVTPSAVIKQLLSIQFYKDLLRKNPKFMIFTMPEEKLTTGQKQNVPSQFVPAFENAAALDDSVRDAALLRYEAQGGAFERMCVNPQYKAVRRPGTILFCLREFTEAQYKGDLPVSKTQKGPGGADGHRIGGGGGGGGRSGGGGGGKLCDYDSDGDSGDDGGGGGPSGVKGMSIGVKQTAQQKKVAQGVAKAAEMAELIGDTTAGKMLLSNTTEEHYGETPPDSIMQLWYNEAMLDDTNARKNMGIQLPALGDVPMP